jgi:hypothetical protein
LWPRRYVHRRVDRTTGRDGPLVDAHARFRFFQPRFNMSEMPPGLPKHPIGTFAFVGAYAVVFIVLWFSIYVFVYQARGVVTP